MNSRISVASARPWSLAAFMTFNARRDAAPKIERVRVGAKLGPVAGALRGPSAALQFRRTAEDRGIQLQKSTAE
jgi:hypothetical protein